MTAQPKSNKKKILEKQIKLRKNLWPGISDEDLWSHRKQDGFTPVPRVMPLVLRIMDGLASRPVSPTYFDLWCRKWDEQFVTMNRSPTEYAFYAGFSGQRGAQTWKARMRDLADLGFILPASGPNGEFSYVLIRNPIKVIELHVKRKSEGLRQDYVNALFERGNQVKTHGLGDMVSEASTT